MNISTMAQEEPFVKRGWEFDRDVAEAFEDWIDQRGMQRNVAAQLGLWIVIHLEPGTREEFLAAMHGRFEGPIKNALWLRYDEQRLLMAFRSCDEKEKQEVLDLAEESVRLTEIVDESCVQNWTGVEPPQQTQPRAKESEGTTPKEAANLLDRAAESVSSTSLRRARRRAGNRPA